MLFGVEHESKLAQRLDGVTNEISKSLIASNLKVSICISNVCVNTNTSETFAPCFRTTIEWRIVNGSASMVARIASYRKMLAMTKTNLLRSL